MANNLYVVVYPDSATDPADDAGGRAQIVAGQNGDGGAATYASGAVAWTGSGQQVSASGLSAGTIYRAAAVVYDGSSYSNRVLSGAFTALAAGYASFTLSGQAVGFPRGRTLTAAYGAFTLSGQAVGLPRGRTLTAAYGSFTLAGQAVAFKITRALTAAYGSFTLSGQDVGLTYSGSGPKTLTAAYGSFVLSGQAVGLSLARSIAAAYGSFALAGQDATLTYTRITERTLTAETGSFTLYGPATGLHWSGETVTGPQPAGKPSRQRKRRKYEVEIDGEVFDVGSPEEAQAVLEQARDAAQEQARKTVDRAVKAVRREPRKVVADAKRALKSPEIVTDAPVPVQPVLDQIRQIYAAAMRDVEIAMLMRKLDLMFEQDDEDVLMLL